MEENGINEEYYSFQAYEEFNEFRAERFSAKMFLDTFSMELTNILEPIADKEIRTLTKKLNDVFLEIKAYDSIEKNKLSEDEIFNIESELHSNYMETVYIQDEIWALIEMKILYAFKFWEVNIKKLLRPFFPNAKYSDFYKWELLKNFLKDKNIIPENLKGYNEVYHLKEVNNLLKHSGEFNDIIKKLIPEFKGKEVVTFRELNSFYERVKSFPIIYLAELANAIQNELYEFNDEKIEKLANSIANRMEETDALKLIEALKLKYIFN